MLNMLLSKPLKHSPAENCEAGWPPPGSEPSRPSAGVSRALIADSKALSVDDPICSAGGLNFTKYSTYSNHNHA